jgi:Flp pilus assembly protein TadD
MARMSFFTLRHSITKFLATLRINSNDGSSNDAEAYHNRGVALWKKGDVERAIAEFRAALRIDPNLAKARGDLGVALGQKGDLEGAIAEFRAALAPMRAMLTGVAISLLYSR